MWLYDTSEDRLGLKMVRGAGYDKHKSPKINPGVGIAGQVFSSCESIVCNDVAGDPRFVKLGDQKDFEAKLKEIICVPLLVENQAIGVINVVNKKAGDGFNSNDCSLLSALASQAARALEHAKLYDLAIKESKTGLYIPRYFEARLHEQITQARRYNQTFSVLITDIDHFKQVNDKYGHMVGDDVIIKISSFIHESLRENIDIACRWGGEEFAIILPRTDRTGAMTFGERYRERVEKNVGDVEKGIPDVTVSVGLATFPGDGNDEQTMMKRADDALYEAKRTGRNRTCAAS
jgi:diguanylate cyclase (GGDEF)-like protein